VQKFDFDGDGFEDAQDCDSEDATIYPGAIDEYGDGIDQDCDECPTGDGDGIDRDCDGFPANASEQLKPHYDCNDSDPLIHPDATDIPNDLVDQDCDGFDAVDVDEDGFLEEDDCDDENADIFPGADDPCDEYDLDSNCDGADGTDADGDGVAVDCGDMDCDDDDPLNYPGNVEACDGQDNDCDDEVDEGTADDLDGDGFNVCQGADCDDFDPLVYPGAYERCDGKDSDCDGDLPADEADDDGDGAFVCSGDCEDSNALIHPAALDICGDELDNDCSGVADDDCLDCDWLVPTDLGTIGDAIGTSTPGTVICVEPGTYTETLVFPYHSIHLAGIAGRDSTVIDGDCLGDDPVLTIPAQNDGTIVEGLTITNGCAHSGGGIFQEYSSPTLRNLRVTGNSAVYAGGGIYMFSSGAELTDLIVEGNEVTYMYSNGGGLSVENGTPTVSHVTFRGNHAAFRGGGVGMMGTGEEAVFRSVIFDGNSATGYGGGLSVVYMDVNMVGGLFIDNESDHGGGMALDWNEQIGAPELDNVLVLGNRAAEGGGVYLFGCDAQLSHFTVAGNEAIHGGGMQMTMGSSPTLDGFVIADNVATDYAGALMVETGEPVIQYSTLWNNGDSVVEGTANPVGVDGNVDWDPQFLRALSLDAALWDVHLGEGAGPVGAGNPATTNPDGTPADMGAYGGPRANEWDLDHDGHPGWWQAGPYDPAEHAQYDCDDRDATMMPGEGC